MRSTNAKLMYVFVNLLYGTIGPVLHFISFPSEFVVLCRGIIGALFLYLLVRLRGQKPDRTKIRKNLKYLIGSGMCLGINWICLFAAYRFTTVAIGSLCNYMAPIFLIFLSPILYREKLTPVKILCVIAAFFGILLVIDIFHVGSDAVNPVGILFGFGAAAGFFFLVLFNRKLTDISVFDRAILQLAISAITVLPYFLINNSGHLPTPDLTSVLLTVLLGVLHTGVAYYFYFNALGSISVQAVSLLGYLEPATAVLFSAFILREGFTVYTLLGAVLVIGAALASELLPSRNIS